jgi:hypothetical protein
MVEGSSLTPVLMHADYFSDVAALDVDLDGRRDLVFVDSFEAVHVAFGQAAGGFGVPVLAYQGSWHSTGRLEAADLDADGVPEIVISRQRYEYDGYDVALGLAWDAGSGAFVEVASVNGSADGFRSLLGVLEGRPVVAEGSQNVTALEADLTLGERILDSPDSGEPIQVMAKGDVDGDGIEDLALASDQELWILVGVGGPIDSDMETGTIDPGTGDTGTVDPDPDPTPADTSAGDTGSLQTSPGDGDDGEKGRCGCASTPTPTGWSLLSRRR